MVASMFLKSSLIVKDRSNTFPLLDEPISPTKNSEAKNVEVLQKMRGMRAPMQVGTYVIGRTPCVFEYISQRKKPRSLGDLSNRLSFCFGLLPKLTTATKAIFLGNSCQD